MSAPWSGESAADRFRRHTVLLSEGDALGRPGSLLPVLASTRRISSQLLRFPDHTVRRLVEPPSPTNVHRLGPVIAAGAMITPQDVTRLRVPTEPPAPSGPGDGE